MSVKLLMVALKVLDEVIALALTVSEDGVSLPPPLATAIARDDACVVLYTTPVVPLLATNSTLSVLVEPPKPTPARTLQVVNVSARRSATHPGSGQSFEPGWRRGDRLYLAA